MGKVTYDSCLSMVNDRRVSDVDVLQALTRLLCDENGRPSCRGVNNEQLFMLELVTRTKRHDVFVQLNAGALEVAAADTPDEVRALFAEHSVEYGDFTRLVLALEREEYE